MIGKMVAQLTLTESLLILLLVTSSEQSQAKESPGVQQQPLAQLDKVIRQANGIKVDSIVDSKLASNVTNTLNEMALNLRKMFMENKRLSNQVQDVLQRMQNATGVNATSTINGLQQQASNMSSMSNLNNLNVNNMMARFQGQ